MHQKFAEPILERDVQVSRWKGGTQLFPYNRRSSTLTEKVAEVFVRRSTACAGRCLGKVASLSLHVCWESFSSYKPKKKNIAFPAPGNAKCSSTKAPLMLLLE